MIRHYFLTTLRTLRQNPLYTVLSVFGIALTFVFVCVLFLFVKSSKGNFIPPKYTERTWQARWLHDEDGNYRPIRKADYEKWVPKMTTPEMITITNNELLESVVVNDKIEYLFVQTIGETYFDVCQLKFINGRPINKQEIAEALPVAIIDRHIRSLFFAKSEDPIGKSIEIFGKQFRIVGVVENSPLLSLITNMTNANIWIPAKSVQIVQYDKYVLSFTAKDKASIADVQDEFTRVLNETNTAEGTTYKIAGTRKSIKESNDLSGMFSIIGALILMLIPALNILSLNVSKSHDRSEEIAIRKAFGAPLRTVFGQLLFENTLITLAGAIIGMCVTPLLMHAIDQMILGFSIIPLTMSLKFDWTTIFVVACPCVLAFSFLSGSIPAWIIAKRDIVNVLKGETK